MSKTAPQPRRKWTKAKREFADIAGLLVSNANVCLPAPGDILYQADFCSDDERRQLLQEIQDREFLVAGFDRRIGVQKYALQDENADCPAALQTLAARVQARWNSPRHPTHVLVERYSTTAWSFNGDYAPNHIVTRFETRADLGNNNDDGFAVARVVLTHPVIHHTNRPAEKQELMWTLTTADHHTNLLLPTGSLLVQRGEFLHAWRSYTTAAPDGQAPSIVLKFLCLPIVAADDGGQEIDFGYVASEADRIPRTGVLPALPELLTIIVTTSPIKSHPSTQMLERTFDTFQLAGEDFVDCRKVIVCDGFRHVGTGTVSRKHSNPKQAMRNGIVTEEQANNYIAFKQRLRLLCKGAAVVADSPFRNTSVEELEERMGYGFALRHALRHCVSTPFVCVIQHDRTFMRPTPMRDVVHAMWRHRNIKYVGISMRSNLIYRDIFNSKYGSQEEFEKMVLRPPELLLDASKYGPGGDFHEILSAVVTKDRVLRNLDSFADAYKTSAQCLEQAKWIEANPPPEGKCQLTLTPTLFWYDNTHICETAHYRDFVFDPKYKMVARGGFVEDKLSPVLKRTIERLGLTDGHSRFGCYLLDDHSGYFFTGHLDGGNFIARENNGNLSRSSSDTAQESENLSRSSSDMVQESENLSRSSGDKEPGEESTLEDDTSSVGSDEGLEAEKSPWWSNLAVLGDSMSALLFSAGLVLLSVGFSWYLNMQESLTPEELAYRSLGSIPRPRGSATVYEINPQMTVVEQITEKMKHAYRHDGVLALRGLISPPLLKELQEAADELIKEQHFSNAQKRFKVRGKQFFTVHHGAIFRTPQSLRNHTDQPVDRAPLSSSDPMNNPFLRLMAHTSLSQVGASLLHHTMEDDSHSKDNLRILRDIFLAKDDDPFVCGWHVDDHGFWPAMADAPGINLWVALDDYNDTAANHSVDPEGGFALAVGSHVAHWRHEAYHVTGAAPTVPEGGFSSALDMVSRRVGSGTCNIAHSAPHLQRRLEETKRIYRDLQAGDVIFHDRWLFHRTIPQNGSSGKIQRRYSIRLGPGSSIIPPGYGTEPSVLHHEENGGKTADDVSQTWPFYPRVYPSVIDSEMESWGEFCESIYPAALEKQEVRKREMRPHLQRLAQRQQIHPQANNRLFDFSDGYS